MEEGILVSRWVEPDRQDRRKRRLQKDPTRYSLTICISTKAY